MKHISSRLRFLSAGMLSWILYTSRATRLIFMEHTSCQWLSIACKQMRIHILMPMICPALLTTRPFILYVQFLLNLNLSTLYSHFLKMLLPTLFWASFGLAFRIQFYATFPKIIEGLPLLCHSIIFWIRIYGTYSTLGQLWLRFSVPSNIM